MSATKKQIKANQQNAQKSTGPKTEEGKAISSQNGTTYGLFSQILVINSSYHSEDRVEFELLVEDLRSELNPQSFFQEKLIKKIAICLWKSQRAAIAETAQINQQLEKLDEQIATNIRRHSYKMDDDPTLEPLDFDSPNSKALSNLIGINSIPDKNFAARILYYGMRVDRELAKTYNLLRKLQHKEEHDQKEEERKNAISKTEPNSF